MSCLCGLDKSYESCCGEYLSGQGWPKTAEALMRARYTAFTENKMDFVEDSHDPKTRESFDRAASEKWAKDSQWLGLEIIRTEAGTETDDKGLVEFIAHYKLDGEQQSHHEMSQFVKRNGRWYFSNGKLAQTLETYVRPSEKVGRNDPCICGSGKKYKKCCG